MNEFNNNKSSDFNSFNENNSWGNNSYPNDNWGNAYPENNWDNNYTQNNSYNVNNYNNNYSQGNSYPQNNAQNSYTDSYNNFNNQNSYNGYGDYKQNNYNQNNYNQNNYNIPTSTGNRQNKFFRGEYDYIIPENSCTVCIKPKSSKLQILLIFGPFLLMPIAVAFILIFSFLSAVFPETLYVVDVIVKVMPVIFVIDFILIFFSVTIFPLFQSLLQKRRCKTKVKGVIKDVSYGRLYKGVRRVIPLYNFSYKGKDYYFEGRESRFDVYQTGTEIEVMLNENDPTDCYALSKSKVHLDANDKKSIVIVSIILAVFLIFITSSIH